MQRRTSETIPGVIPKRCRVEAPVGSGVTETLAARALLRSTVSAVRGDIARCVGSGLVWQAVAVAVPWGLERAVEEGMVSGDRAALGRWSAVLVLLGVVRWTGDGARHWWVERAWAHAADHLRRRLTRRLVAMGDDEAARFGHGDLTARVVDDTTAVWAWVSGIATFATAAFTVLAVVAIVVACEAPGAEVVPRPPVAERAGP